MDLITMKKFLLSSVALFGLTAGAMAADLPARRMAPAPFVAVPVFTWTGFYVGVNAGYGFNSNNNDNYPYYALPGTAVAPFYYGYGDNGSDGGFVGGGQVGYNYQFGSIVVGVEADIQYADLGGGRNNGYYGYYYGGNGGSDGYFGTVRARLGVAFDRVLVYATGGFAYGDVNKNSNNGYPYFGTAAFPFGYGYGNNDSNSTGYAVGGGVEYAVTNNITIKLEGLYVNLGNGKNDDYPYFLGATTAFNPYFYGGNRKNDQEFGVVRAGLNYKF